MTPRPTKNTTFKRQWDLAVVKQPIVIVALTVIVLLAGCSTSLSSPRNSPRITYPATKENTMTPDESIAQIVALFDAVKDITGGSWVSSGVPTNSHEGRLECALPDGTSGVDYSFFGVVLVFLTRIRLSLRLMLLGKS